MGAAVTIELAKPIDGSDIISNGSLDHARSEIIRLRSTLGIINIILCVLRTHHYCQH